MRLRLLKSLSLEVTIKTIEHDNKKELLKQADAFINRTKILIENFK